MEKADTAAYVRSMQAMFDKPQLIRIVKKPDDSVVIDHVGKASGRVYVAKR